MIYPLVMTNIAIGKIIGKPSLNGKFSIVMLVYWRVLAMTNGNMHHKLGNDMM